jgi:putative YphP/YqiW family bacilliredoxin
MYDPQMIEPMRRELTDLGISETRTPEAVEDILGQNKTTLVVINSVCGCAAANARPAVSMALKNEKLPENSLTVFGANDAEAVAKVREHLVGYPPSSPNIALFKDGDVVFNLERHHIEGRSAGDIAADIAQAFNEHC